MFIKQAWEVLKQASYDWVEDRASQLGAALAFYSILSLAPLLVIAISIAGFIFGEQAARGQIVAQIEDMVGQQGAEAIQIMLAHANRPDRGIVATVLGVAMLLVGATGFFNQLRDSLNIIWDVPVPEKRGIGHFVRDWLFPFFLVMGTGFLLLVSLVLSAAIAAVKQHVSGWLPGQEALWHVTDLGVSFILVSLLFALIYKVLPATRVEWRDVWFGALLTAALFMIGKLLLGLYLGKSGIGSAHGAAGSLVVLVVWIYYASQILFFGAELTQVVARRYGSKTFSPPKRHDHAPTAKPAAPV